MESKNNCIRLQLCGIKAKEKKQKMPDEQKMKNNFYKSGGFRCECIENVGKKRKS